MEKSVELFFILPTRVVCFYATDTDTVKDDKGQTTSASYNLFGNIKSMADAGGRSVSYEYHPLQPNVMTSLTDDKGKTTHYTYDKK